MELYVPFFRHPTFVEFADVKSWKVIDPHNSIRTGDIFIFSASSFLSSTIKLFTRSRWNHVGMACWCEIEYISGTKVKELFCFELGSQPFTCLMTREPIDKGVRLVRLADISDMYDMIAVRKLEHKRGNDWCERFQEFMMKWKQKEFPNFLYLAKAYLIRPGVPEGKTTCAQITALMMDEMGVHKLKFDPSQLTPDDFASHGTAFPEALFNGKEIIIYQDPKWMRVRIIFIVCVLVVLILILFMIFRKTSKTAKVNSDVRTANSHKRQFGASHII